MPLSSGDVKFLYQRETFGTDANGQRVPVYEIGFTVRGSTQASVTLPQKGFTAMLAQEAILAKAAEIVKTMEMFP